MLRRRDQRASSDAGFTLIELLIVIVILGVLAGIAILAVSAFRKDASGAGYDTDRRHLETAIVAFYAHSHAYPGDLQQLVSGGYLDNVSLSGDHLQLIG